MRHCAEQAVESNLKTARFELNGCGLYASGCLLGSPKLVCWLACWLVGWLVAWWPGRLVSWLVTWRVVWFACWPVGLPGWLISWLPPSLVRWWAHWLFLCWLVGCLVGRLVCFLVSKAVIERKTVEQKFVLAVAQSFWKRIFRKRKLCRLHNQNFA